jgi:hypothetical protein
MGDQVKYSQNIRNFFKLFKFQNSHLKALHYFPLFSPSLITNQPNILKPRQALIFKFSKRDQRIVLVY